MFLLHHTASSQGNLFFLQDPAAGAYEQKGMDPFSSGYNPASITGFSTPVLAIAAEKRHIIQGFSLASLSFTYPAASGRWNVQTDYFGFENYAQTKASLTYARSVGRVADIGARFYYHQIRIPGYLAAGSFSSDIGMRVIVKPDFIVGWSVLNPFRLRSGRSNPAELPSLYRFGIGYSPSAQVTIVAEAQVEEDRTPAIVAGVRYRPIKEFMVRMGVHTGIKSSFLTVVLISPKCQLSFSFSVHPYLGISSSLMGAYFFSPVEIK